MTIEEILLTLETALNPIDLNQVQTLVMRQVWEGKTYAQIAKKAGYNTDYIKSVGSQLCQWLTTALGEPVTKRNFRSVLQRRTNQLQGLNKSFPRCFFGRTEEIATLKKWIVRDKCRLVSVLGMEGVGKTALTVRCAEQIQDEFDYVIWRSLHKSHSIDDLLADWLQVLSNGQETDLPNDTNGKISRLINYLQQYRCLLVIDDYDAIVRETQELEDEDLSSSYISYSSCHEIYIQLLQQIGEQHHQSCLLLTSRQTSLSLELQKKNDLQIRSLVLTGLRLAEAQKILRVAGLSCTDLMSHQLIERYAGNPLALKIVATVIRDLFNRDVANFLAQNIFIFDPPCDSSDQQLTCSSALAWQMKCLQTIYRE